MGPLFCFTGALAGSTTLFVIVSLRDRLSGSAVCESPNCSGPNTLDFPDTSSVLLSVGIQKISADLCIFSVFSENILGILT